LKLTWAFESSGIGNQLGYTTHQNMLKRSLKRLGVEFVPEAPITVSLTCPYFFRPRRFTKNVLSTMFEFSAIPSEWKIYLDMADLVVVPCKHNQEIFGQYTKTPIEICPEGVDPTFYPFRERTFPAAGEPFVFLFVGANNTRKGTYHTAKAWERFNERYPELTDKIQLVMKMTDPEKPQEIQQITCNSYIDWRVLPLSQREAIEKNLPPMMSVYHYAHAFLFPTLGEGYGLTIVEAMATGLPCIYTPYSGPVDFVDEADAYPIFYSHMSMRLCDNFGRHYCAVACADPDIEHIVDRMYEIYTNYGEALERGARASAKMQTLTWDNAAAQFLDILEYHFGEAI